MELKTFMENHGESFVVIRGDYEISSVEGLKNTEKASGRKYIGFYPNSDIIEGDWVRSQITGDEYYIEETLTDVVFGKPFQKKGYYKTRFQLKQDEEQKKRGGSSTFNINNAYNSVIGNQNSVNINNNFQYLYDLAKEKGHGENDEIVVMLKEIEGILKENKQLEKGSLQRYSENIEKHSWIAGAIAQTLLGWLTSGLNG